ncbi:membrane protein, PF09852 family [Leptospira weilii serovar Topaz str. LT2116]|uniref:Membrane protein, PF09852 family n=1 Tax=Leptospira weilii serovar Topaz str. LT2116 TaxID=1088540 RepID=M3EMT2_9LEPT|nr:membrane protein, PF09852 family [Leptospira weilii serovar Topaz str. LT2116]
MEGNPGLKHGMGILESDRRLDLISIFRFVFRISIIDSSLGQGFVQLLRLPSHSVSDFISKNGSGLDPRSNRQIQNKISIVRFERKKLIFILVLTFSASIHRNSKESEYPIVLSPKPDRTTELKNVLKQIPAGSSVSAGFHLSPFVPLKNPVYPIRENREWKEWILLDQEYNSPYLSSEKILERVDADVLKGKLHWVQKTNRFGLLRLNTKPSVP